MQAKATFETQNAAQHMSALCTHFAKKVNASLAGANGRVDFDFGTCELTADDMRLTFLAQAQSARQLSLVTDVVTRHLERFAFRENPILSWDVLPPAQSLVSR